MPLRRAAIWPLIPWLLATGGAVLACDALVRDTPARFVWFGVALGAVCAVPLLLRLVLRRRAAAVLRRCAFAAVPTLLLLLAGEVAARVLRLETYEQAQMVAEPRLGQILARDSGEADRWGFRNATVPERADAVFLGDSQAYGYALRRSEAMPQAFATLTGRVAYGMALGGYSPVQYRELTRRALSLRPSAIVVVMFLGNDLVDAHRFGGLEGAEDLRDPQVDYPPHPTDAEPIAEPEPNLAAAAVALLTRWSRLANWAAFRVRAVLKTSAALTAIYGREPGAPAYEGGAVTTLFTPEYRLEYLNTDDMRVRDGLRMTERCLRDIATMCRAAEVQPVLVPLPTKEAVYRAFLAERGQPTHRLDALAAAEAKICAAVSQMARAAGITVADPTAAFLAELRADRPVWPRFADGHLAASGAAVVAAVVRDALR
jgi:hypothetical protein